MIEKIDTNQPLIKSETSPRQSDPASVPGNDGEDASLQVDYASLIDEAIQTQQPDDKIVQQARKLLSSGQLESPENIRTAAENIIKFGI